MENIHVTAKIEVSSDRLENLFVSAVEGGSNYWCRKIRPLEGKNTDKKPYYQYMLEGFIAYEEEPSQANHNGQWTVTKGHIEKAVQLMAEKYPKHFSDLINENDDADTGDVFLQLCVFGELVYG